MRSRSAWPRRVQLPFGGGSASLRRRPLKVYGRQLHAVVPFGVCLSASGTGVQRQLGFDQGESLARHRAHEVEPGSLQEPDVFLQCALSAA